MLFFFFFSSSFFFLSNFVCLQRVCFVSKSRAAFLKRDRKGALSMNITNNNAHQCG